MSRITIMLLTYNRLDYAETTLHSVLDKMHTSHDIHVHIASDGDDDKYMAQLTRLPRKWGYPYTTSNSNRGGYGANYNLATQVVHPISDYVLPLEDDWELTREVDIDPIIMALESFNCVRLGYIGYTQPLHGTFEYIAGFNYLRLDPDSEEPHVFAGHPRLETVRFEREVGEWPLGVDPGATEFIVAHRPEARQGIAWPCDLIRPSGDLFAHIGTVRSY